MQLVSKKFKKTLSVVALVLILAMVLGTVASALTGCGAAGKTDNTKIRVAALKGATTIGIVNLIADTELGDPSLDLEFTMYTQGSDVMAAMVAGTVDIGLVPSNVAAVMNNKVEGGVSVIDINTLGVLNCLSGDEAIKTVADLSGKTVYMTGQGATPEYTVRYLLQENGVTDCDIQFKSEPTEIVSIFAADPNAVAILPQPFVTAALAQTEGLKIAFSLDDEWAKVNTDSKIVTGVTVVSNKFLKEHKAAVDAFIGAHKESADKAVNDVETTAKLVVSQGIMAKEPLAVKAIPNCNVVCISGSQIKENLAGYFKVLFEQDPKSVGGSLPGDDFYYEG